ncbi:MAG: TetR/AcrR family transcriptional regulator [Acidimicrobiales bacterium]
MEPSDGTGSEGGRGGARAHAARPYHHGDLRRALVTAGVALARQGGAAAVTVRAAARLAGVTAPAAYRHFEDRDQMLAEVARHCRQELAAAMIAARDRHRSAVRRFDATGRAYMDFALAEPGLIDAAFAAGPAAVPDDPDAYAVLAGGLDELSEADLLAPDRRDGAELVAWTAVHGAAALLARSPALSADAAAVTDRVLLGVRHALGVADPAPSRSRRTPR